MSENGEVEIMEWMKQNLKTRNNITLPDSMLRVLLRYVVEVEQIEETVAEWAATVEDEDWQSIFEDGWAHVNSNAKLPARLASVSKRWAGMDKLSSRGRGGKSSSSRKAVASRKREEEESEGEAVFGEGGAEDDEEEEEGVYEVPENLGRATTPFGPGRKVSGVKSSGGKFVVLKSLNGDEYIPMFDWVRASEAAKGQGLSVRQQRMFAFALEVGTIVPESTILSCESGSAIGEAPRVSQYVKVAKKNGVKTMSDIVGKKDLNALAKHVLKLQREFSARGMQQEGVVLNSWWTEFQQYFMKTAPPKKAEAFEYLEEYLQVHAGVGLPGPIDHTIMGRVTFDSASGGGGGEVESRLAKVLEEQAKLKKRVEQAEKANSALKAQVAGRGGPPGEEERGPGGRKKKGFFPHPCHNCGVKGHKASECTEEGGGAYQADEEDGGD